MERFWAPRGIKNLIKPLQNNEAYRVYRSAPSSNRPARPRSGQARAEMIVRASCLESLAALAVLPLLLFVVLAIALLLFLLLSLLLRRLQCSTLSGLTRFPFHDSQVTGSA